MTVTAQPQSGLPSGAKNSKRIWASPLIGTALLALGAYVNSFMFNDTIRIAASLVMIAGGAALYFYTVWLDGDVLSFAALFSAAWIVTVGLCFLRILPYQKAWASETWGVIILAHIGISAGIILGNGASRRFSARGTNRGESDGRAYEFFRRFTICPGRLYFICIAVTVAGVAAFCANAAIKGYIPLFARDIVDPYYNFYTKFNIFTVAATVIPGLCLYTLRSVRLPKYRRAVLGVCIALEAFVIPLLLVSRGTQLTSVLALTYVYVAILRDKRLTRRFIALLLCIAVSLCFYGFGTTARRLDAGYLEHVFGTDGTVQTDDGAPHEDNNTHESGGLPASAAFFYGYLTVSHDNLNEAVLHRSSPSYGLRQLSPFLSLIPISSVREGLQKRVEALEFHRIRPDFNTGDLVTDAYYDFGTVGSAVWALLAGFALGTAEGFRRRRGRAFSSLTCGVLMSPVLLCFFDSWGSNFTLWLLLGTVLLCFVAACLPVRRAKHGKGSM